MRLQIRMRFALVGALVLLILAVLPTQASDPARPSAEPGDEAVRSTTGPSLIRTGPSEPGDDLEGSPALHRQAEPLASYFQLSERDSLWMLLTSDTFWAYIPVGATCVIRFEPVGDTLGVDLPPDPVVALAYQAIGRAPSWLAVELYDAFARMDTLHQETYAQIILDATDPVVDEIAFVVAHTAPQILQSPNFYTGILTENAEDVYAHDALLDYVAVVDYGSSAAGGDYYSTVRYRTAADRGDTTEVELPRERYYWDIVHPKITDELPTYINPATGGAADPPTGRF